MVMSRRERYIGIGTAVVVGVLVLDQLFVSPLLDRRRALGAQVQEAQDALERHNRLFINSRRATKNWSQLAGTTLRRDDAGAESDILNNVRDWASRSGMNLLTQPRERTEKQKDFIRVGFRVTGSGGMKQVGEFLWRAQTASIPVRVNDVQMSSKTDGTDNLSVVVGLSTIYADPEKGAPAAAAATAPPTRAPASADSGVER